MDEKKQNKHPSIREINFMENKTIKLYLQVLKNVNNTMNSANENHNFDLMIQLTQKLNEVTKQLEELLKIEKSERFIA